VTVVADTQPELADAVAAPASPYKGLVPYGQSDTRFFFGRDRDREVIAGNLLAAKLTLLYGPSGVGKSSVLRAGVASDLRRRALEHRDEGSPASPVVVVRSWRDDPLASIAAEARRAVVALLGDDVEDPPPGATLADVLAHWSGQAGAKLLVVFDQFEEYFLYHEHERGPRSFDEQFPAALNRPDLRANFLISMRDDALARLDRFKGRILNLFDNRLQIHHLTIDAARDAIMLPIEEHNRLAPASEQVRIQGALVDDVIEQVRTGLAELGSGGLATPEGDDASMHVEAPFLQVVMTTLWEAERKKSSHELRAETLEELGGAQKLARDRLDERIGRLTNAELDVAGKIFQFLVTRSGTKIAYTAADLADVAELRVEDVEPVLERLAGDARILRTVPPRHGSDESRYEIFHDVLGPAVLDWRTRHHTAVVARRARRKARISYGIAAVSLLAVGGLVVLVVAALHERASARSQRYVAQAIGALDSDPFQSVRLAQQALATKATPAAESAFRVAVSESRVRAATVLDTAVYQSEYSADGTLVLSQGGHRVRVWNPRTGRTVADLHYTARLSGNINDARFAPRGHDVITAGWDGTVRVWAPPSWRGRIVARGVPQLLSASLSPDGTEALAVDWYGTMMIVDLASRKVTKIPHVAVAEFSPDGRYVVSGGDNGVVQVREARTGRIRSTTATGDGTFTSLTFDRTGGEFATGTDSGVVETWRLVDGHAGRIAAMREGRSVNALALSSDGALLAASGDKVLNLWHALSGRSAGTMIGHEDWITSAEFSPDGGRVLTASTDTTAKVWDLATHRVLLTLSGNRSDVNTARFNPTGTAVVTAGSDGTARVWDATTGTVLARHRSWVLDAQFTGDGRRIFTTGDDHELMVWNGRTGAYLAKLRFPASAPIESVAFDPVAKQHLFVTALTNGTAIVRNSDSGARVATIDEARHFGEGGGLSSAVFSPDGRRVLLASTDWHTSIWNARTGRFIAVLAKPTWNGENFTASGFVNDAVYNPDGTLIVTTGDDRLARVWTASGKPRPVIFTRHRGPVLHAVFDPKRSRFVATSGADETVRVWDVNNGKQYAVLDAGVPVSALAFSRDGRLIATGSPDGTTRVWDWRRGILVAELKMHADFINSIAFSYDGTRILTASDDHTAKIYACPTCGSLATIEQRERVASVALLPLVQQEQARQKEEQR
jgi:WD40 repeat protein